MKEKGGGEGGNLKVGKCFFFPRQISPFRKKSEKLENFIAEVPQH